MAAKYVPQTAEAYARYRYMLDDCDGILQAQMSDTAIVHTRIRAFMDGVNWAKRQRRKRPAGEASAQSENDSNQSENSR